MRLSPNKIKRILITLSLATIILLVVVFLTIRATPRGLNDQELLAFRKCFGLGTKFSGIDELTGLLLIKKHSVYVVRGFSFPGELHPPPYCLAAVGNDHKSFKLPEDFNKVMVRENLSVETVDTALLVAETYARVSSIPGRPAILDDYTQIPKGTGKDPSQFDKLIIPPNVSAQNGSYSVSFYTWTRVGGRLDKWSFIIKQNGVIEVDREQVESLVGDVIGLP